MDEDANVTIWLKGAVQMSGGGLLAAYCLSLLHTTAPGEGPPQAICARAAQEGMPGVGFDHVVGCIPASLFSLD